MQREKKRKQNQNNSVKVKKHIVRYVTRRDL